MNNKRTLGLFSLIVFAGMLLSNPLNVLAGDAKGTSGSGDSQTLEAKVKEALREHKDVKIEVKDEDVILRGYVNTRNEKNIVESQVRGVPGVKYVRDEVKIGQNKVDAIEDSVEDATITTKLKAKILATKGLDFLDIHVETEQGVVTLSGKVKNAAQVELAGKVAHETEDVKGVMNKLSVITQ